MLVNIVDGKIEGYSTVEDFAKRHNIGVLPVYKRIHSGELPALRLNTGGGRGVFYISDNETIVKKKHSGPRKIKTNYPTNIISFIFGENFEWEETEDRLNGLSYAISQLSEREQVLIQKRFMYLMTYDDIGEELGITRERVRQILIRVKRKLKNPLRLQYIEYGYNGAKEHEKLLASKISEEPVEPDPDKRLDKYGISDAFWSLRLSVRATNCMCRANLRTIHDILNKIRTDGMDGLIKLPNLGIVTLTEIIRKIEDYYETSIDELIYDIS